MKNKSKLRAERLLASLEETALKIPSGGPASEDSDEDTQALVSLAAQPIGMVEDTSKLPRMKKFRFQLLHQWLIHNFTPRKVADIGGGKGLLGYLLQTSGWQVCVIDPVQQPLPDKYKDIVTGTRIKITPGVQVACLAQEFEPELAQDFDLLIGMHAHGCNAKIIDAAARYGCGFVIFPCCVINEPFYPPLGVHWLESLADYAVQQGHHIHPFRLNFKGQSIGIYGQLAANRESGQKA